MVNVLLPVMPIIFTANEDDQDMCAVFSFCFNVTSIQYLDQFRIISWKSFALAYFLCCIKIDSMHFGMCVLFGLRIY